MVYSIVIQYMYSICNDQIGVISISIQISFFLFWEPSGSYPF
jgi:hypothetical protein